MKLRDSLVGGMVAERGKEELQGMVWNQDIEMKMDIWRHDFKFVQKLF